MLIKIDPMIDDHENSDDDKNVLMICTSDTVMMIKTVRSWYIRYTHTKAGA